MKDTVTINEKDLIAREKLNNPSFAKTIWREIIHDKMAIISLILLIIVLATAYLSPLFIDQVALKRVNFLNTWKAPSAANWLGTDDGGRDVFGQLMIGARNSFTIGIAVTVIAGVVGLSYGLISGFYGGHVDNVMMRFLEFMMVLPTTMFIIVLVTIIPNYNVVSFILILSIFGWLGKARLIRSRALQERELDYINASKTLGTPSWKIMFFEMFPNLSSLVIVNMTLTLAGNIGIETGLTFLGYGLPAGTPSLGTLVAFARNPDIVQNKWWVWLPAALLILVMMLCINYVGQAVKRASDARQRLA
ncbi:ABC transporter permease [Sporosarcina thermotolerans]|uniref:ABC transporter permease n=1 Tax=Sporosarcina thermotolerans TaxID=633404 RepID=A0AAW9A6N0_9BACL|nr:ABC transporter permease [Sporosarcina thermotolerans]MDW0116609.1 ABC transporter permease [Sporosarcina thermotolerans]WHT48820.1 ABC transporter permease [Sporosarcina thermotolerans]